MARAEIVTDISILRGVISSLSHSSPPLAPLPHHYRIRGAVRASETLGRGRSKAPCGIAWIRCEAPRPVGPAWPGHGGFASMGHSRLKRPCASAAPGCLRVRAKTYRSQPLTCHADPQPSTSFCSLASASLSSANSVATSVRFGVANLHCLSQEFTGLPKFDMSCMGPNLRQTHKPKHFRKFRFPFAWFFQTCFEMLSGRHLLSRSTSPTKPMRPAASPRHVHSASRFKSGHTLSRKPHIIFCLQRPRLHASWLFARHPTSTRRAGTKSTGGGLKFRPGFRASQTLEQQLGNTD